jgi:hypothetical protein
MTCWPGFSNHSGTETDLFDGIGPGIDNDCAFGRYSKIAPGIGKSSRNVLESGGFGAGPLN